METWNHKYTSYLAILFTVGIIILPIAIVKHRENVKLKKELTLAEKDAKDAYESKYRSKKAFGKFTIQEATQPDDIKKQQRTTTIIKIKDHLEAKTREKKLTKKQIRSNKNKDPLRSAVIEGEDIGRDLISKTVERLVEKGQEI
jgi:glucan-binding YG repeat protein